MADTRQVCQTNCYRCQPSIVRARNTAAPGREHAPGTMRCTGAWHAIRWIEWAIS
jgi:hypothetical protein